MVIGASYSSNKSNLRPTGLRRPALLLLGLLSTAVLVAEHGFGVSSAWERWIHVAELLLAGGYVADRVLMLARGPDRWSVLRRRQFEFGVLGLFLLLATAWVVSLAAGAGKLPTEVRGLLSEDAWGLGLNLLRLFLLGNVLVQLLRLQQRLLVRGMRPEWMLAGSFALLIVAGTLLLLMPRVSAIPEKPIGVLDAVFTATSASCVTGLTVRDTGTEFTAFGQGILLVLFQVGGMGIMTFVAFLAVTSAESLPVSDMLVFRQVVGARTPAVLGRQLWAIIGFTAVVETAGAVCLYSCLPPEQELMSKLGWSVFHSVSAYCNAGFSFSADSLAAFQSHPGAMLTFMVLIVLGGLGFLVAMDLLGLRVSRLPLIRDIPWVRRYNRQTPVYRIPVQTRLSVLMTGILLVAGLVAFWVLEARHILADKPLSTQFWISAFHSVSPRSSGFSTVPVGDLHPATLLLLTALMAVGACPVSAGGGIKVITLAILILALRSLVTGRERVEAFGRALPPKVLLTALAVAGLFMVLAGLGVFGMTLFDPQVPLESQVFEVVSALSTTGLSTGITAQLSQGSQVVLCLLMFIGRVGPLSLVLSVVQLERSARYQYPEEDLLVA
ncbi:MAG TPA: potassium transporter TrkG [Verrucomicrobiota bacterium]|nr:potassium transporter TrkG [Verrucomicrobiota bacterium]HNU50848.1 potassium transporter TrkG [Verrucomicrobiota bacterium]